MITYFFIKAFLVVVYSVLFGILSLIDVIVRVATFGKFSFPVVVNALPFGIDSLLVNGMGYVHYIALLIPPVGIMLDGFVVVVIFKLALKFVRMIPFIRGFVS